MTQTVTAPHESLRLRARSGSQSRDLFVKLVSFMVIVGVPITFWSGVIALIAWLFGTTASVWLYVGFGVISSCVLVPIWAIFNFGKDHDA